MTQFKLNLTEDSLADILYHFRRALEHAKEEQQADCYSPEAEAEFRHICLTLDILSSFAHSKRL